MAPRKPTDSDNVEADAAEPVAAPKGGKPINASVPASLISGSTFATRLAARKNARG